ncbi:P-loop containing nucleoside triphosphate hydrolase protein, partial [Piptocephalis cylindrospora]
LPGKGNREKQILKNITGALRPGRFTVIMGASGAGKTSFLNLISGEARLGGTSGQVLINGKEVRGKEVRELTGFVQQDDLIMDTMTVREAVTMSALLRIPPSVSREEKLQKVDEILDLMQLTKAADTIIGSAQVKGVSGGERKRTSISMELVSNPSILFLDEPTSGLDTYTAYSVCKFLKELASSGRTIVATLHQPSSEIFDLIDDVVLLANGEIMYAGPADQVVPYFGAHGYPCPDYVNPADFLFMNVLNQATASISSTPDGPLEWRSTGHDSIIEPWSGTSMEKGQAPLSRRLNAPRDPRDIQRLLQAWKESELGTALDATARSVPKEGNVGYDKAHRKYHSSFFTQLPLLVRRGWKNSWRNKMIIQMKLVELIFLAFFIDSIFWKIGEKGLSSQSRRGLLFFLVVNQTFSNATGNLMTFYNDRFVFEREHRAGMYSLPAYFTSKALVEIPFFILLPLLMVIFTYFAAGLQVDAGKFFICAVTIVLAGNTGAAIGLFSACTFKRPDISFIFVPLLMIPLMMFSGIFVNLDEMQGWIRWLQWLSTMKYGYVALVKNEMDGL